MIRLLVVDDSALMRKLLGSVFAAEGDFEVAFARDGDEALAELGRFLPDVVTLDVNMPGLDGLACLDRIMLDRPTPTVMVSSLTADGAEVTLDALDRGAIDFVAKPGGAVSLEMDRLGPLIVSKVRAAARARLRPTLRLADRVRARTTSFEGGRAERPRVKGRQIVRPPSPSPGPAPVPGAVDGIVLVGTSTGGPPALDALLSGLPADFPWPVVVAQHMPGSFTGPLARRLDGLCALRVQEAARPMPLAPGNVYVGKGDADVTLARRPSGLVVQPVPAHADYLWHPSVDRLVASALDLVDPARLVGVLMTGMGRDGAVTMSEMRRRGGRTIAESEETAVVWGMPGELVRAGGASVVTPLDDIAGALLEMVP
ncbi:chemotaxis-specific protein-glutamate methyltransferase CheB [Methylobacterium sp. NMS14P]|uniref:chemotaxis-specific protein-glutamate methyltransferase CheB n=1 Tax=Methylobacterium sp. NMS14P TaxID=2894310 RepID=UPI002359621A|nr:chemotaxis-specific protein-glutamate methyltransferase CheB [Methylobacterium sp. NMS14P]WCS23772.1 chemotaxis-specific protein-glutamate methyltransferase CheB [Methylobacterium sp. NMS14P]